MPLIERSPDTLPPPCPTGVQKFSKLCLSVMFHRLISDFIAFSTMNPKHRLRQGVLQQILKSLVIKGKELDDRFRIDKSDRSWIRCKNDGVSWDTALNLIALIEKYAAEKGIPGPIIQVADFEEAPELPKKSKDIEQQSPELDEKCNAENGAAGLIVQVTKFQEIVGSPDDEVGTLGQSAAPPSALKPPPIIPNNSMGTVNQPPSSNSNARARIHTALPTSSESEQQSRWAAQRKSGKYKVWTVLSSLVFGSVVYGLIAQLPSSGMPNKSSARKATQPPPTPPVTFEPRLIMLHSETQCGTHLFEPNELFWGFKPVRNFLQDPFRNYDEPFAEIQEHLTEVPNETGTAPIRYALDELGALPQFYPRFVRCSFHKRAYIAVVISAQYETEPSSDEQHVYYAICSNTDDPSNGKEFEFKRFPKTTSSIERRSRVGMRYNVTAVVFPIEETDADTSLTLTLIPPP